jgi:TonB family protein
VEVSDVLRDRMQEPAGLQQMAVLSALVHGMLVAALVLAPGAWFSQRVETPRQVMTITLGGGAPGPANGGISQIGGRPVQAETPPEAVKRPEPVRPPAAAAPKMTVPEPNAKPAPAAARVDQAPPNARGRTPTRGEETAPGSSVAETGARGQGFGLSTGGGAGSGVRLDVADFCCPEYIVLMVQRVHGNWNARAETPAEVTVKFTIQRDGRISDPQVEKTSGYTALDLNALRALVSTRQLPPLPAGYPHPTLTVHLTFLYQR